MPAGRRGRAGSRALRPAVVRGPAARQRAGPVHRRPTHTDPTEGRSRREAKTVVHQQEQETDRLAGRSGSQEKDARQIFRRRRRRQE